MSFEFGWRAHIDDRLIADTCGETYCRDVAYDNLTRILQNKFRSSLLKIRGDAPFDLSIAITYWQQWARDVASEQLKLSAYFIEQHPIYNRDAMSTVVIPKIIVELTAVYPTVVFNTTGSSGRMGIRATGDLSVIPAFYWMGLLQRLGAQYALDKSRRSSWESADLLLAYADSSYSQAWKRLKQQQENPPWQMLAFCAGPMITYTSTYLLRDASALPALDLTTLI